LLTPKDHTLILIDFQSQMSFATKSIDPVLLRSNAALISRAAAGFDVSTILTTVAEKTFSGPMYEEITSAFPGQALIDRTSMNTWEDAHVIARVNEIGKSRIVSRASRSMQLRMPAAMSPMRRTSAQWNASSKPAHAR